MDETKCAECDDTWYIKEQTCLACASGCLKCLQETRCTACLTSFYHDVDKNSCNSCRDNCLDCKSANACTVCKEGFKVGSEGMCESTAVSAWHKWKWVMLAIGYLVAFALIAAILISTRRKPGQWMPVGRNKKSLDSRADASDHYVSADVSNLRNN